MARRGGRTVRSNYVTVAGMRKEYGEMGNLPAQSGDRHGNNRTASSTQLTNCFSCYIAVDGSVSTGGVGAQPPRRGRTPAPRHNLYGFDILTELKQR
nr:hypothetical protein [Pseudanabaena sp. PCC 6802]